MPRAKHVTVTAFAAELGITERTLLARIREAGIRPRRFGRFAVLTEAECEVVGDATRERSPAPPPPGPPGLTRGRAAEAVRDQRRRESRRQIARARNIVARGLSVAGGEQSENPRVR